MLSCKPLTTKEADDWVKKRPGRVQLDPKNFRYDFVLPRDHPFNAEAINVFTDCFLKCLRSGHFAYPEPLDSLFWDRRHIEVAAYNHAKTLKAAFYREHVNKETMEERHDRMAANTRSGRRGRVRIIMLNRQF